MKGNIIGGSKRLRSRIILFRKENMVYDAERRDEYTCFHGRRLKYLKTIKRKSSNGYSSQIRIYECEGCSDCPYREKCTKSKEWNRRIELNVRLASPCAKGVVLNRNMSLAESNGVGVSGDSS